METSERVDRLIHVLLREQLGGQAPPDLTDRVLQAPGLAWNRLRWRMPALAAAAVLLVGGLIWIVAAGWYPSPQVSGDWRLVEGEKFERGATIASGKDEARLRIGGYCDIRLEKGSTMKWQGQKRAEEVFLDKGSVTCEVDRNVGTFTVQSDVGSVEVTGTKFSVRILAYKTSQKTFPKRMLVKVLAGSVLVSGDWGQTRVEAPQEKMFGLAWSTSGTTTRPTDRSGKPPTTSTTRNATTNPSGSKPVDKLPASFKEGDAGVCYGTVVEHGQGFVTVQTSERPPRKLDFYLRWVSGGAAGGTGPDLEIKKKMEDLKPGQKVRIQWVYQERLRVVSLVVFGGSSSKPAASPKDRAEQKRREAVCRRFVQDPDVESVIHLTGTAEAQEIGAPAGCCR